MNYYFETYGCQMNKAESAATEQILCSRGWSASPDAENADLIIINTCSVRATAETRIHGRLGWFSSLKKDRAKNGQKDFTLIVMGCMAQRLMENLKKQFSVVDYVVGNFQTKFFNEIFNAVEKGFHLDDLEETPVYTFATESYEKGSFSAFVPIMHGCNNFCSYCIVPYVRGRELSRSPNDILMELDQLNKNGVKEITLLGQNVNSYCWNKTKNESRTCGKHIEENEDEFLFFPELLKIITAHIRETSSSIEWVRFMSSHPKDLSDQLIGVIAEDDLLCRHIHLPVQCGSTSVLNRMNRRYTREHYIELVEKIRKNIPDVSLTSDILIGFPGETDEEFEQTVSIMKQIRYEAAFMYYYNIREGTPAASYKDQISIDVKKSRLAKIIDIQQKITKEEKSKQLGKTVKVLVENLSHNDPKELVGRTERDECVVFVADKSLIGNFVNVKLEQLSGITFRGRIVDV
ncbi:MAG: tRNA (N6-isopentenyl adenosine(37)-C2)-methylthiotransferase MiaB [Treponemataceae bacterium]